MITIPNFSKTSPFSFVASMKSNASISGNVLWNITSSSVRRHQRRSKRVPRLASHVSDPGFDSGRNEHAREMVVSSMGFLVSLLVRYSGRTECQTVALAGLAHRTVNFERKASQRFSRRASYAIRKKIQEQEAVREQEGQRLKTLKAEQEAKLHASQRSIE